MRVLHQQNLQDLLLLAVLNHESQAVVSLVSYEVVGVSPLLDQDLHDLIQKWLHHPLQSYEHVGNGHQGDS